MRRKILILAGVLMLLTAGRTWAEEKNEPGPKYNLGNVIVTATKTESYQAEVGSSSTVITAEDIEETGKRTVQEFLRDVPGVAVQQSSVFGGTTAVYIRGAKPGHTLVLIDGIEVNDPMSTDRSFEFAHLMADNIERIEVVRGPQSTLYGSDAMGGVINIITKKGKGKPKLSSSFEGGSYATFREDVGLSGGTEKVDCSISASRMDSRGISKAANGSEKDGYTNTSISSKMDYNMFDNAELSFVARFTDADNDLDDAPYDDDPNYNALWRDFAAKLSFNQAMNSWWDHSISFSCNDVYRKYKDENDGKDTTEDKRSWYKGGSKKIEWQHNFFPVKWDTLTAGFEYEEETGSSYYCSRGSVTEIIGKKADNKACYFQNQLKLWEIFFITLGLRADNHNIFGTEATYKISTAYLIPQTGTRLNGNWGTAFKAPSLYQLYSNYGDPNLKPDRSRSYDFGFEQSFFNDKISFDLAYFHNNFKNMVDWDSNTPNPNTGQSGGYKNVGRAETKGFEIGVKFLPIEILAIGANFTYTDTKDKETGLELLRRPKTQANADVNWRFIEGANLNLGVTYVGSRRDAGYIENKGYTVVRLFSSYDITGNFQIFGRVENLFNKKYEDVRGYAMPRCSLYGGVKAVF